MSDYVKLTDFAAKDSLISGNPAKIVKGTEIDDEFQEIETAVATKADIASPTFTGTVSAPKPASASDYSTKVPTTSWTQDAIDLAVPVSSIILMVAVPAAQYLVCDGSEVSRAGYPDLFAALGTTFGAGDGSTTFNLPNMTSPLGGMEYYIRF